MTSLSDLPDELLELVMSFLPLEDRKNTRLVCKRWLEVSYSPSLIQGDYVILDKSRFVGPYKIKCNRKYPNVVIKRGDDTAWSWAENLEETPDLEELNDEFSYFWSECGEFVKFLVFNGMDEMTDFYYHIFSKTPNLKGLAIKTSLMITAGIGTAMTKTFADLKLSDGPLFPKLAILHVDLLAGYSEPFLLDLLENAPFVQVFRLEFTNYHSMENYVINALELFTREHSNILERFQLFSCPIEGDDLIKILSNLGPTLAKLHLCNCGLLDDSCLPVISRKCPNLTDVDLTDTKFSDNGFFNFIQPLKKLAMLTLRRTQVDELTASLIPEMPELCFLDLREASPVFVMDALGKEPLPKLTYLSLILCNLTDEIVGVIVNCLPNITTLYLDRNGDLTKNSVQHIATSCKKLEVLSLRGCCNVSEILPLAQLEHLENLDVYCCGIRRNESWWKFEHIRTLSR